jgi:hypothetical protein
MRPVRGAISTDALVHHGNAQAARLVDAGHQHPPANCPSGSMARQRSN